MPGSEVLARLRSRPCIIDGGLIAAILIGDERLARRSDTGAGVAVVAGRSAAEAEDFD